VLPDLAGCSHIAAYSTLLARPCLRSNGEFRRAEHPSQRQEVDADGEQVYVLSRLVPLSNALRCKVRWLCSSKSSWLRL
jgi:hypothetical protein